MMTRVMMVLFIASLPASCWPAAGAGAADGAGAAGAGVAPAPTLFSGRKFFRFLSMRSVPSAFPKTWSYIS